MAKKQKETLLDLLPKDAIDVDTTTMEEAMDVYNKQKNQNYTIWKKGNKYNTKENPFGSMTIREFMSPNKEGVRPYDILKSIISEDVETKGLSTNPIKDVMKYTRYVTGDIVRAHLERHDPKNDLLDRLPTDKPSDSKSKAVLGTEPGKTRAKIGVTGDKRALSMFFEELNRQTDRPALIPMRNAIILNANTGLRPNGVLDLRLSEYDRETGSLTIVPELDEGQIQEAETQEKKTKKRRGVSKKGFGREGGALTVTIPLSEDAVQAIEDQIAFNEKNSKYNVAKENNPPIFVKANGSKVETKDVNTVLETVRIDRPLIQAKKLLGRPKFNTFKPTKQDFIEAGLPENTTIGKSGIPLFRNLHTIVSMGARIPNDDLEFLQGRAYTSGSAKRLGYAERIDGEFFPEEKDLANKVGNFYREATGRPLVPTDLTIKIDDEDIQADNKQFTTKFDEKTAEQSAQEKVDRTAKASETEALTQKKNRAILEELQNIPEDQKTDANKIHEEKLRRSLKIKPEADIPTKNFLGDFDEWDKFVTSGERLGGRYWIDKGMTKKTLKGLAIGAATTALAPAAKAAELFTDVALEATPAGDRIQDDPSDFEEEELLEAMQSDRRTADLTPVRNIAGKELSKRVAKKEGMLARKSHPLREGPGNINEKARRYVEKYRGPVSEYRQDLEEEYQGFAMKQLAE